MTKHNEAGKKHMTVHDQKKNPDTISNQSLAYIGTPVHSSKHSHSNAAKEIIPKATADQKQPDTPKKRLKMMAFVLGIFLQVYRSNKRIDPPKSFKKAEFKALEAKKTTAQQVEILNNRKQKTRLRAPSSRSVLSSSSMGGHSIIKDSLKRVQTTMSMRFTGILFSVYLILFSIMLIVLNISIRPYIKELNKNFRATMNYCEVDFSLRKASALTFETFNIIIGINRVFNGGYNLSRLEILDNYTYPSKATFAKVKSFYSRLMEDIMVNVKEGRSNMQSFMTYLQKEKVNDPQGLLRETLFTKTQRLRRPVSADGSSNYSIPLHFQLNMPAYSYRLLNQMQIIVEQSTIVIDAYLKENESDIPSVPINQNPLYSVVTDNRQSIYYNLYGNVFATLKNGFEQIQSVIEDLQTKEYNKLYFSFIIGFTVCFLVIFVTLMLLVFSVKARMNLSVSCYTMMKDDEIDAHISTLSQLKTVYREMKFNEVEHMRFWKSATVDAAAAGAGTENKIKLASRSGKKTRSVRNFVERGTIRGFLVAFLSNNAILALYCALFAFIFIMKNTISKSNIFREMRMNVCHSAMNVNNNILDAMLFAQRGRQLDVENRKIESNPFDAAPTKFTKILLEKRSVIRDIVPEHIASLDQILTGDLCKVLEITDDVRDQICGYGSNAFSSNGMVNYLIWMENTNREFKNQMRLLDPAFLEYSDGLPVLGDTVFTKPRATNSQVVWYSFEFVRSRYVNRIIWSKLFRRISTWIEDMIAVMEDSTDNIFKVINAFGSVLVIGPTFILVCFSILAIRRSYEISLFTFYNVDPSVLASNPYLLHHFKMFFSYT